MSILIFLALIGIVALNIVMYAEIEHLIDNQHEIYKDIQKINRQFILNKSRKGKK